MYFFTLIISTAVLLCCTVPPTSSTAIKQSSKTQGLPTPKVITVSEYLDTEKKYLLTWNLDEKEETIFFEVAVETKGYVGFGISPNGDMNGADIFIAGVNEDGSVYGIDYHGVGNQQPVEDINQNWNLTSGEETDTETKLKFHRLLNTCDNEDFKITDATMRIIWAIGSDDNVNYHGSNKGTKSVNFFSQSNDADFKPELYEYHDVVVDMEMPPHHTSYWCTIHRLPKFSQKQHIVAFEPILESLLATQHTHHFIFTRCAAPENEDPDEFFGKWVGHEGHFCYEASDETFPFSKHCNQHMVYAWSKGGKRMVFPPDVGLPMPDKLNQNDYYGMELHFDNPEEATDLKFKTGGRIFYSNELRDIEAGLTVVHQATSPQLTIPPLSENFIVSGHCASECTEKFLPEEGVTIFNNMLHAHLAGRKLKLRQFRGEQELPWIDSDDYYDFDFQQNKQLTQTMKLEKGDHLVIECTFDTMNVEGNKAVIGGLSSHEEMCQAWFFYYPASQLSNCFSMQDPDAHMSLFGVTDYEPRQSEIPGGSTWYYIKKPDDLAGNYLDSISDKVNWTEKFREDFQKVKRFGEQVSGCIAGEETFVGLTKYPDNVKEYVPVDDCKAKEDCKDCSSGVNIVSIGFINVTLFALFISKVFKLM